MLLLAKKSLTEGKCYYFSNSKQKDMAKATKPKPTYTEKYRRGAYETDRTKVINWIRNQQVSLEIREAGINDNNTEFVTITINNIPRD